MTLLSFSERLWAICSCTPKPEWWNGTLAKAQELLTRFEREKPRDKKLCRRLNKL